MLEPFGFKSRTGVIIGLDIDILRFIAKELRVKLQLVPIRVSEFIDNIDSDNVDIVAAAITHTLQRDKKVDFTISYFYDGQSILSNSKSSAISYKNFEGKNIGAIKGTTSSRVFKVIQPLSNIIYFDDYNDMFTSLTNGNIDAITSDSAYLFKKVQKSKGKLKMIGKPFTLEPYAMAIKENESNLRDIVNFAIQKFVKTGEYEKEYKKWFGKRLLKRKPVLCP